MMTDDCLLRSLNVDLQALKAANQRLAMKARHAHALAAFGLLLNLVVVSVAARPGQAPKTIEAQEFVLRSAEGKMLGALRQAPANGGGQLMLMKDDKLRINMGIDTTGVSILDFYGTEEEEILQIATTRSDGGLIMLNDRNHKPGTPPRLAMYTDKDGSSGISMASPAGHEVMRILHKPDIKTGLTFYQDADQNQAGSMIGFGINQDKLPGFSMRGNVSKAAAWIGFDGLGLPYLQMLDLQGKSQLRIPAESLVQEPAE